jgi:hypothetical protein
MKRGLVAAALLAGAATAALAQIHTDTVEDLPDGPGRETVFDTCTACHGVKIITQQGLSPERWASTIDFMVERHGMLVPLAEERRQIIDYLATHFPPKQKGYSNPFLKK